MKVRPANVTDNRLLSRAALPTASAAAPEPSRHAKESGAAADTGDSLASAKKAPARAAMKDENPYPIAPPTQRPKMKDENPYPASTETAPAHPSMQDENPYGR